MWDETVKHLGEFDSAVVTWTDQAGHPFSVRCHPTVDADRRVLWLDLAPSMPSPAASGPAGLLCHRHHERLFNQRSFVVRGVLEQQASSWCFRPHQFIPGAGLEGILSTVRFTREAQKYTKHYLALRGLPRPAIPWQVLLRLKAEAAKEVQ